MPVHNQLHETDFSDKRMPAPTLPVAVIMERRALANRWQSERWAPVDVVPDDGGPREPRLLEQDSAHARWLHPGFAIELHRDEADGYYLNMTTATPYVFVNWHMVGDRAVPKIVTVSYHEAGRMMDGGEQVDGVPLPAALLAWLDEFVRAHYRPEEKKKGKIKPPSFKGARRD
jgi:Protein of unknown function (DUF3305)